MRVPLPLALVSVALLMGLAYRTGSANQRGAERQADGGGIPLSSPSPEAPEVLVTPVPDEPTPRMLPPPLPKPGRQPVEVDMQNVDLHVTPSIVLRIRHLRGRFVGTKADGIPFLDDKDSYVVVIDTGEIAMGMASLNALMSGHVLGGKRSNIDDLEITTDEEGRLVQKGDLDKKIDIPFKTKGEMSATPDGRIRVHTTSIKGPLGLPIRPLMKLFSIEMDDLVRVEPGHGVTVDENDLILDPQRMLPPPHIRGKITRVRVEGDFVIQTFGSGARVALDPPPISKNHIYWRRGELMFGKLLMANTDLELVDEDPADPFDFSVDRWNDQLVAGYAKNTPGRGLKSHMPDFNDLGPGGERARAARLRQARRGRSAPS